MFRETLSSIPLLLCSLFAIGCTQTEAPLSQAEGVRGESADATVAGTPPGSNADLSIPQLDPKPVVWFDDWPGIEPVPQARQEAQYLMSLADGLKADENFEEAEQLYYKAMEADPTWAYPAYQLACNYELWNQHDRAVPQFAKAVGLGFDDFPTALIDDELGQIREGPGFRPALLKIRERYLAASGTRVGQPIAVRPRGPKPRDGWPAMLLLHGYGDTNLSYLDDAKRWAELGFVCVTVPGSIPTSDGRYMWAMDSTDPTHHDLQKIAGSPLLDGVVNRKKVFLLGFSQGGLHAMLLTAENPDAYAGVVGLSPGGSMAERLAAPPVNRSGRPARCIFIHGTREPYGPCVRIWSDVCKAAGWKFDSMTHPGSHHFPEDWDVIRPRIAAFLNDE